MNEIAPDLIDPKLLRLFDVLYGTRSVTRSAELLGLSQPTISIWLQRLRRELGDALFVRTAAGMAPTPRADALIGPAREVLESLRRLVAVQPAFEPASAQRRFRICMTDASHVTLLPALLARCRAEAPQVRLEAARMDDGVAQALASGEADLALGYAPWLASGIYQQTLYRQDWVCLANATHPRVGRTLSLARYRAEAHVTIAGAPARTCWRPRCWRRAWSAACCWSCRASWAWAPSFPAPTSSRRCRGTSARRWRR